MAVIGWMLLICVVLVAVLIVVSAIKAKKKPEAARTSSSPEYTGGLQEAPSRRKDETVRPTLFDTSNPEHWRTVKPEDIVTLTDVQAVEDAIREGRGTRGISYTVKKVTNLTAKDDSGREIAVWRFMDVRTVNQPPSVLVAKIVGSELDLYMMFVPEYPPEAVGDQEGVPMVEPGNRADMILAGHHWLFAAPEGIPERLREEDCTPEERLGLLRQYCENDLKLLKFADDLMLDKDGGQTELAGVRYYAKPQGLVACNTESNPEEPGVDGHLTGIVEYVHAGDYENPILIITETGGEDSGDGGHIELRIGAKLDPSEVEVLRPA